MKRLVFLLFIVTSFVTGTATGGDLKPFVSDGCSSFPDGTLKQKTLWLQCCIEHDKSYWLGGTYEQKLQADDELKACVAKVGGATLAQVMHRGVRVGGAPWLPTTFRWGYGWPYPRGYKKLTKEEIIEAERLKTEETAVDGAR
ncbi:MAG TPA: hypothetical protein ENJ08_08430 [Gammaproteobacteria bacterium]|nr:hypothetical protein [Gammaproteobacteria bacterium]